MKVRKRITHIGRSDDTTSFAVVVREAARGERRASWHWLYDWRIRG